MTVKIGNPRGKICLMLDKGEAIDLAYKYGLDDWGAKELLQAVELAYPESTDLDERPGLRIVVSERRP